MRRASRVCLGLDPQAEIGREMAQISPQVGDDLPLDLPIDPLVARRVPEGCQAVRRSSAQALKRCMTGSKAVALLRVPGLSMLEDTGKISGALEAESVSSLLAHIKAECAVGFTNS